MVTFAFTMWTGLECQKCSNTISGWHCILSTIQFRPNPFVHVSINKFEKKEKKKANITTRKHGIHDLIILLLMLEPSHVVICEL
jgi:hypothetical protein